MDGKGNRNVFFIQIDASNFAEFEISEFEISRVDSIYIHRTGEGRLKGLSSFWEEIWPRSKWTRALTIPAWRA